MKRVLFVAALVAPMFMASCNNSELQRLQQENDSLRSVAITGGVKIDDYLAAFNSIQENLAAIKEKEQIISMKTGNGEVDDRSADQINSDITSIYELMLKNKQTIKDLNTKLQQNGIKNKELAKTIQLLTEQMETKDKELATLKDQLERMNVVVADLDAKISAQDSVLNEQMQVNEEQSELISSQDAALNTVFYVVGTKKELVNHNVVSKEGMFKGLKIGDSFDKNYFTQVDLRQLSSVMLNTKKANILSSHPTSSYKLVSRGNVVEKLEITDPVAFWERSKFLVIVVD
ncbi:MAG: Atg14 domain-containing protein [Bacteroidales bacterium]|nr:Atg14 domain-containing protein [Bacteroidales bacterium]